MRWISCSFFSCLLATSALASEQEGTVTLIAAANSSGEPYGFAVAGQRTTKPACASNDDIWTISNPSSDAAKAVLSLVLTAKASNQHIRVVGNGACDAIQQGRETVAYITIQ